MSVERVFGLEYRDELADTRYPFSDSSSLKADTGYDLPKDIFLDAAIYPAGLASPMYLKKISVQIREVILTIGNSSGTVLITGTFDPLGDVGEVPLYDKHGRSAGIIVSDEQRLSVFQSWQSGDHDFGINAEFVASTVIPMPQNHVSGFLLPDGSVVTGDIWLVGENGVAVRQDTDDSIRIDLIGDPLFKRKLCSSTEFFTTPNFVKTINNIPPNSYGDFQLSVNNEIAADTILRIYPEAGGNSIRIELAGQQLGGN
jgi:hypothetical protein